MKLSIKRAALADLMAKGGASAPKNSPVPIIGHARLIARRGVLRVSTTDYELQAEALAEAEIEADGSTTVDAGKLSTIVSRLPVDAVISLAIDGADLVVKSGRSRVKLATLPVDDWPALDAKSLHAEGASFDVTGTDLSRLLGRSSAAAGVNKSQTTLASVFLHTREWNGSAALAGVGTNGHILVAAAIPLPEGADAMPANGGRPGIVVSLETASAALKLFKGSETVRITVSSRLVSFEDDATRLTSKLLECVYPDYPRIIPEISGDRINFLRAPAVASVTLLESFATREQGHKLECGAGGVGLILAAAETGGDGIDYVEGEVDGTVQPFGVSSLYLKQMLGAFGTETITLSFTGIGGAIRVYADDDEATVGVIMPMRVSGDLVRRAAA